MRKRWDIGLLRALSPSKDDDDDDADDDDYDRKPSMILRLIRFGLKTTHSLLINRSTSYPV